MWILILVFSGHISGWMIGDKASVNGEVETGVRVASYVTRAQCDSASPKGVKHYCIPAPVVQK